MSDKNSNITNQAVDPVCQMKVPVDSPYTYQYLGKDFHFCSEACVHKFASHPGQYLSSVALKSDEQVSNPEIAGIQYTCPMHPEVIQNHPGICPKCGMALEPLITNISAESADTELKDMRTRLWFSTALALPVFILAMMMDLQPQYLPSNLSFYEVQWIEFVLATPVVLWGGGIRFLYVLGYPLKPGI